MHGSQDSVKHDEKELARTSAPCRSEEIQVLPPLGLWTPCGYGPIPTAREFLDRYRDFFLALIAERRCAGFCYVQLYDVEGEVNGYLTYDRKPKVPPGAIRAIHADGLRARGP